MLKYLNTPRSLLLASVIVLCTLAAAGWAAADFASYSWTEVNSDATWEARAGLQVVELRNELYLMGGRTPRPPGFPPIPGDSDIWADVWTSADQGNSWTKILESDAEGHWPARAYFQAVTKGNYIYVLGGQNFNVIPNPGCPPFPSACPPLISTSDFFNDVWRSRDGIHWEQMTDHAPWEGRAGLSAVALGGEIYVLGGSENDDSAIIGGPPQRIYFNDVWKSRDGRDWTLVTEDAPWEARAGGVLVAKGGSMYLLGGENGFLCEPLPQCQLPYFNDVWRSKDGADWDLVTPAAEWTARPGHQCVVLLNNFVCFGGFGPFGNPSDVWVSKTGEHWTQVSTSPWNAASSDEIKYDFDALAIQGGRNGMRPSILTFGGDRETFDFADPTNYLRVDNDVWRFSPGDRGRWGAGNHAFRSNERSSAGAAAGSWRRGLRASPNPFNPATTIEYAVPEDTYARLDVYDMSGRKVRTLVDQQVTAGEHFVRWDARNDAGERVASGTYVYRLQAGDLIVSNTMLLLK
jgi:hypothetical protein